MDLIDTYVLFGDPATRLKTTPTASTLISFTGIGFPGRIELNWETANEIWLIGFNLYRSDTLYGDKQRLNTEMILAKKPGQMYGDIYSFEGSLNLGGNNFYWLELVQITDNELAGPIQLASGFSTNIPIIFR